jgi:hypothetical protein
MNNCKENLIIWQKWQDPFGETDDELEEKINHFFDDNDESIDDNNIDDNNIDDNIFTKNKMLPKHIKVIATPMGIIPMNDNTSSGKIFNFWLGHTNFNLTKGVCNIIESADGVETLDIFTRYRFRISVGKAFTDSSVMKNIQESVYEYIENNQ